MTTVKYDDLETAFEFVSAGAPTENSAYVSLDTGHIYWVSDYVDEEEEVPEDLETSDRYLAVPHKNNLDLGRHLVMRFVEQALPDREDQIHDIFRRKGAYGRFKNFLDSTGHLEQWYRFEETAQKEALRKWCAQNNLEISP